MDKVSDTPRTNFVAYESVDAEWNRSMNRFGRMLAHACILERELAAAQAQRDKLEKALKVIRECLVDGAVTLSEKTTAAKIAIQIDDFLKECGK